MTAQYGVLLSHAQDDEVVATGPERAAAVRYAIETCAAQPGIEFEVMHADADGRWHSAAGLRPSEVNRSRWEA